MPLKARGLFSGIFQPGFNLGVVICVLVNMMVVKYHLGWKFLFYIGGSFSFILALSRCFLPESEVFLEKKKIQAKRNISDDIEKSNGNESDSFVNLITDLFWNHSAVFLWATALSTGLSGLSNGSLFPLYLEETKKQSTGIISSVIIIGNIGGIIMPWITGYYSQIYGRKLLILLSTLISILSIPLCIYPTSGVLLLTGYFFLQAGFQGGWVGSFPFPFSNCLF